MPDELILGPGMPRKLRCTCGAPLGIDDGDRCEACRPQLSAAAREYGMARRLNHDQLEDLERRVAQLEVVLRKLKKKVDYHARKDSSNRA